MKLKILNIFIVDRKQFMTELRKSVLLGEESLEKRNSISFDSLETFKRLMTINKFQILMAISRVKPESINQLAKFLDREYPHVLKDCKTLKELGFIKLDDIGDARKQFKPKLTFSYDLVRVKSKLEEIYPVSERSHDVLLSAHV